MKKSFVCIFLAVILLSVLIFAADMINITRFIPLSERYDWLVFGGIIISGLAILYGLYLIFRRR